MVIIGHKGQTLDSFVPGVCVVVEHEGVVAQNLNVLFTPA